MYLSPNMYLLILTNLRSHAYSVRSQIKLEIYHVLNFSI